MDTIVDADSTLTRQRLDTIHTEDTRRCAAATTRLFSQIEGRCIVAPTFVNMSSGVSRDVVDSSTGNDSKTRIFRLVSSCVHVVHSDLAVFLLFLCRCRGGDLCTKSAAKMEWRSPAVAYPVRQHRGILTFVWLHTMSRARRLRGLSTNATLADHVQDKRGLASPCLVASISCTSPPRKARSKERRRGLFITILSPTSAAFFHFDHV